MKPRLSQFCRWAAAADSLALLSGTAASAAGAAPDLSGTYWATMYYPFNVINGGKSLDVAFTVDDPGSFYRPWSGRRPRYLVTNRPLNEEAPVPLSGLQTQSQEIRNASASRAREGDDGCEGEWAGGRATPLPPCHGETILLRRRRAFAAQIRPFLRRNECRLRQCTHRPRPRPARSLARYR